MVITGAGEDDASTGAAVDARADRETEPAGGAAPGGDRRPVDRRAPGVVGRHARLEIVFERRRAGTVIAHSYAEPPFRIGRWYARADTSDVIVASSAPGVFGGDVLQQRVHVRRGAKVRLTSQSSLQVHPRPGRPTAALLAEYEVEDGAVLHCDWHPAIPFANSVFDQRQVLRVADDARLFWSDAFMAGRVGRDERWAFQSLSHQIRLIRDSGLAYLERFALVPGEQAVTHRWLGGDAAYFGTVLVAGREPREIEEVHGELTSIHGIRAAADVLEPGLAVVRLTAPGDAHGGAAFHHAREHLARRLGWRQA
jgi:urease accessory protein